jgi:hypothetical protein
LFNEEVEKVKMNHFLGLINKSGSSNQGEIKEILRM